MFELNFVCIVNRLLMAKMYLEKTKPVLRSLRVQ